MNSLHGIHIANDAAAVRGKTLTWDRTSKQLRLGKKRLTQTFLSRKKATEWAVSHGATVSAV